MPGRDAFCASGFNPHEGGGGHGVPRSFKPASVGMGYRCPAVFFPESNVSGKASSRPRSSRPNVRRPLQRGEVDVDLVSGVDYGPLTGLIGYNLRRAQIRIYQDFLDTMEPWSITPPRFSAMVLIRHNADMKLTELARAMGIARSGAVEVVNSLEKLGYVKRCDSRTDRRAYALALTQEGEAALKKVTRLIQEHDARISAHLSEAEQRQLRELLERLG